VNRGSSSHTTRRLRASSPSRPRSGCSRCSSSLRKVSTTMTRPERRVVARKASRSRVERSAQCRSSTTHSSGAPVASRWTSPSSSSNSRPWPAPATAGPTTASRPQARSGSSRANSGRAGPATAASSAGSSWSARPRSASMTGANGSPSSPNGTQPPCSTRTPCWVAVAASCSASRVLPTPASPPSSATSGWPSMARVSSWCSRASSWVRPTNRPAVTWEAMSALVCRCAAAEQDGRDLKTPGSGSEDPG
jgi:hypothetical protein